MQGTRVRSLVGELKASLVAQQMKNLPAVQETWLQLLGWEEALEKAAHSSILASRIPEDRGAWQATVCRVAKSQTRLKQPNRHVV